MRTILSFMIAMAAVAAVPGPAVQAAAAAPAASPRAARFQAFFATFRKAVLANDRQAVAGMVHFPFVDFRAGRYCEPGDKTCKVSSDTLTSRDRATFLAKYDRIFTPAVVATIRAGKVRGFKPGEDDGEMSGPIVAGEYLLESTDIGDQRVFVPAGGTWKLARIPFYS